MDRKSQKLTNILLFIIVCFFVLGALLGLGRTAMMHRGFDRNVGGCGMQGQEKGAGAYTMSGICPFANK